ncbi:MAG: 6-bladed beta-propeller [Balneolaceae bacterium]
MKRQITNTKLQTLYTICFPTSKLSNLLFLGIVLLTACSQEKKGGLPPHVQAIDSLIMLQHDSPVSGSVKFEREIAFTDSLLLSGIPAIAVDEDGTVYFAGESWKRRHIYIFDSEGSYRESLGSYGDDMGQFLEIGELQIKNETLLVLDRQLNRRTSFEMESGELIDTLSLNPSGDHLPDDWQGFSTDPVWVREDDSNVMAFTRNRNPAYEPEGEIRYYVVDENSELISDAILTQPDMHFLVGDYAGKPAPFILPIPEKPLLSISETGRMYSAFTDEFLIDVNDTSGNHLHSYYLPFDRFDLDPDELIHPRFSHNDQLLRVRESATYPEKWPVFYSMFADDEDRIWISTITENREELKWWIIDDRTGNITATFRMSFDKPIHFVKNGTAYTVEKNGRGFREVVRYGFEIKPCI